MTDIVDQLQEPSKKVNSVEGLTRHLNKGVSKTALHSYLSCLHKWVPFDPVIHIDDSDVVKPDGHKFESLGLLRDGSKSSDTKKQVFQFENFRVRKLKAINALNFYITLCMAFLTLMSMKSEANALKAAVVQKADPVKEKVSFCYYRQLYLKLAV